MKNRAKPTIGQYVDVRGLTCRIFAIHDFGTIDVEAIDGSGRCFRITGLAF